MCCALLFAARIMLVSCRQVKVVTSFSGRLQNDKFLFQKSPRFRSGAELLHFVGRATLLEKEGLVVLHRRT